MKEKLFDELYEKYKKLVLKIAYQTLGDAQAAQDVCQELFVTLYKKMDNLDLTLIHSWIIVNTKRKAIDYWRKVYYQKELVSCAAYISAKRESEYVDEEKEKNHDRHHFANELMRRLYDKNPEWFDLLMRLVVEEQAPEDAARELGISVGNLRTKLHRVRKWLHNNFGDEYKKLR